MPRRIQILPPEYKSTAQPRTLEDRHAMLCNELGHLRAEIKRLEGLIKYKDGFLLFTAEFFEEITNPRALIV
jgi:hypothetical protein